MAWVAISILTHTTSSKVIISINYSSTLESLYILLRQYNPLFLYGKIKPNRRTEVINLFNTDLNYRLIIMNTAVGGVGISLHDTVGDAPRYMLISPSYKLLEIIQAASRIYRDGTMSDAVVRVFYGKGNIGVEISILEALARKSGILKGVIDEHLNNYVDDFAGGVDNKKRLLQGSGLFLLIDIVPYRRAKHVYMVYIVIHYLLLPGEYPFEEEA